MLRVSKFLTLTRLSLEVQAETGEPIPADAVQTLCGLLRLMSVQCEIMEQRLAGEATQAINGNVVSLADWAAAKGILTIPRTGGDVA